MINFLYSFITFIIALFFILLGTLTLLLPWSERIQGLAIHFIHENQWSWNLFGLGLLTIGFGLAIYLWITSRRRYHTFKIGLNEVIISDHVIDDYLRTYFAKLFPTQEVPYRFTVKKNKLKVVADFPFLPIEDQKELLNKVSHDLTEILRDFLGYRKTFELSISFEKHKAK